MDAVGSAGKSGDTERGCASEDWQQGGLSPRTVDLHNRKSQPSSDDFLIRLKNED
jgi:hypothetical protein